MALDARGGTLPLDNNDRPVQIAAKIIMQDATGTPVVSPFTTTDATVKELKIPENAVTLVMEVTGADMRFGDNNVLDGTLDEGYAMILDGKEKAIPCADGNSIFIKRDDAVNLNLSFYFESL